MEGLLKTTESDARLLVKKQGNRTFESNTVDGRLILVASVRSRYLIHPNTYLFPKERCQAPLKWALNACHAWGVLQTSGSAKRRGRDPRRAVPGTGPLGRGERASLEGEASQTSVRVIGSAQRNSAWNSWNGVRVPMSLLVRAKFRESQMCQSIEASFSDRKSQDSFKKQNKNHKSKPILNPF